MSVKHNECYSTILLQCRSKLAGCTLKVVDYSGVRLVRVIFFFFPLSEMIAFSFEMQIQFYSTMFFLVKISVTSAFSLSDHVR